MKPFSLIIPVAVFEECVKVFPGVVPEAVPHCFQCLYICNETAH
ncbi:MAG TPA: hypothetical protein PLR63_05295 [Paludibacteraceae bacterium]|nr:hypothetical protein [Paludibacteraceae bacterium]